MSEMRREIKTSLWTALILGALVVALAGLLRQQSGFDVKPFAGAILITLAPVSMGIFLVFLLGSRGEDEVSKISSRLKAAKIPPVVAMNDFHNADYTGVLKGPEEYEPAVQEKDRFSFTIGWSCLKLDNAQKRLRHLANIKDVKVLEPSIFLIRAECSLKLDRSEDTYRSCTKFLHH